MNYDEHSYSYDDNNATSFGNDGALFCSYNEYGDNDSYTVYELTNTYNDNWYYISFDDESISLTQNHPSTEYEWRSFLMMIS